MPLALATQAVHHVVIPCTLDTGECYKGTEAIIAIDGMLLASLLANVIK